MKDVAVIIVGLNACRYVKESFESVIAARWDGCSYEMIYVDNGSADDTLDVMRRELPQVRVISNPDNRGFCKAANQGARIADARHLFFLNDDTLVQDDAVARLVRFLDEHPQAGAAGSRLLNTDFTDQWSGRRFPSMLNAIFGRRSVLSKIFPDAKPLTDYLYRDELRKGAPFIADWVSAAAVLVSREVFEQIGGFAEDYYYWHEAIFCDRIRKTGREVYLHPQSKIVHYEGKGSGKRPYRVRKWHIVDFHQGAYRCYCEHYQLGTLNPKRWLAAALLGLRATFLLAANRIASLRESG